MNDFKQTNLNFAVISDALPHPINKEKRFPGANTEVFI